MALKQISSNGDDKRKLKIGIAIGLFVVAGVVVAWQFMRDPSARVDPEIARKAQEAQQAIKSANPNAPSVPDTAPKPAGPPQKSPTGRGPAQAPK